MPFSSVMSLNLGIGLGSAISIPNPAPPVVRYVSRLDGFSQSWLLSSPIELPRIEGFTVRLSVLPSESSRTQIIFGPPTPPERLYIGIEGGNWLVGNGGNRVDTGVACIISETSELLMVVIGGLLSVLVNGVTIYNQPIDYSQSKELEGISTLDGFRFSGVAFDLSVEVGGVVTNEIPLTNKPQGATQLATVGTVNATMINYTEDVWEVYNAS